MRTGSKELIRDINSHLILEIILREGKISRAALSKQSGLTKATVSAIVLELIEKNLVIEVGSDDTSMGRKPILLTFNASCGHVLSIDLNADPEERHDLAAERPDVVRRLSKELGRFLRTCGGQRPSFKATGEPCPWPDEAE